MDIKKELKNFWHWLWNSESIWGYLVFLIIVFIAIKFLFLPLLSLIFHSALPMAIVESSSMDHSYTKYCISYDSKNQCMSYSIDYSLCGASLNNYDSLNFDEYWDACGNWYEKNANMTKEQFKKLSFHNGFKKGDILIIVGWKKPKIGDVVLFKPNPGSLSSRPIIHRIISEEPLQTKGDHNEAQLTALNNIYHTDETTIVDNQLMGVAVAKIPWLGWLKLWIVDFFNMIF